MVSQFKPPFDDPQVLRVARRRGVLGSGESYAHGAARVSAGLAAVAGDCLGKRGDFAETIRQALLSGRVGLSSQLFAAAGRSTEVAACTVLPVPPSADIQVLVARAIAASAAGMGCGIDLSAFADPASTAIELNAHLSAVNRALIAAGKRPPAFMLTCNASHPRVKQFITAKSGADFGAWVANISINFDEPHRYDELRQLVAVAAHSNGEPGVLFGAAANEDNPTPQYPLSSTAPCAEVFMAPGERCVFVSVNLAAHVDGGGDFDYEQFASSVALAVQLADAAVNLAAEGAPAIVGDRRRIGVGVCGLHTALIRMGIPYAAGISFARCISEQLTYYAHAESLRLARLLGPFPAWATSRWRNAEWLSRKRAKRFGAIDSSDWRQLESDILASGVRNAVVVAYPPTGIVSELLQVSKSYEPHFDLRLADGRLRAEVRDQGLCASEVAADGQIPGAEEGELMACARQITPETHLAIHATFCALADEAGSKTVNLPSSASVGEVLALLDAARELGLKGLTVFRDGCLNVGEEALVGGRA